MPSPVGEEVWARRFRWLLAGAGWLAIPVALAMGPPERLDALRCVLLACLLAASMLEEFCLPLAGLLALVAVAFQKAHGFVSARTENF